MALAELVEGIFGHRKVSDWLFNISYALMISGSLLAILGLLGTIFTSHYVLFVMLTFVSGSGAALGFWMFETCQVTIPNDPPHRGIVTIWGKRLNISLPEGDVMELDVFPFRIKYLLVDVGRKNFDFEYLEVPHKLDDSDDLGATTDTDVSVTLVPDPDLLPQFLNNGGWVGVVANIEDMIGQAIRHISVHYTWEQFTKMKAALTVKLLVNLTVIDFRKLPRSGADLPESSIKITAEDYHLLPIVSDPIEYLFGRATTRLSDAEQQCRLQEIEVFLRIAQENGVTVIGDLGIKVCRLNVPHIRGDKKVRDAAAKVAVEKQELRGETLDNRTAHELAESMVKAAKANGETLPYAEARQAVRVERGRAREVIVHSKGGPLLDAAALLTDNRQQGGADNDRS